MIYFKYILLIFLVVCAICACLSKKLINTIVIFTSYSLVMAIVWIMLESPDLAITEAAVGAGISSILFFVALKKIHAFERKREQEKTKDIKDVEEHFEMKLFSKMYKFSAVVVCLGIMIILTAAVSQLPGFGSTDLMTEGDVAYTYLTEAMYNTGAVNIVTGIILDYRAFDTLGESFVLFVSVMCVVALLRVDTHSDSLSMPSDEDDRVYEPKNDLISQKAAKILVPIVFLYGIYVIMNGHLSPGGGFSGGAIIGAGLILYVNAYGFIGAERFFTLKLYKIITCTALGFYCVAKGYSFFTGSNHIETFVSAGTIGNILSGGFILPLNICVGLVVACTMYSFYTYFRKGNL